MSYTVYILRNHQNKHYIGQAENLAERLIDHFYEEVKYTRDEGGGFKLVYSEEYATRPEAMKREHQLKRWTRAKKEALIARNLEQPSEL